MHTNRGLIVLAIVMFLIILGLIVALIWVPAPDRAPVPDAPAPAASTTTPEPNGERPLSASVTVSTPLPGATVSKTFDITGSAPGPWYFEASFPIKVVDPDGNTVATSYGQAEGDWMTTGLVPFSAHVAIGSYAGPARLVLMRDNPSGMPENDDSVSFDITIK